MPDIERKQTQPPLNFVSSKIAHIEQRQLGKENRKHIKSNMKKEKMIEVGSQLLDFCSKVSFFLAK